MGRFLLAKKQFFLNVVMGETTKLWAKSSQLTKKLSKGELDWIEPLKDQLNPAIFYVFWSSHGMLVIVFVRLRLFLEED